MKDTDNEHFHVCIPFPSAVSGVESEETKFVTKFRARCRSSPFNLRGNEGYSSKVYDNGPTGFVFYSGHEGTEAFYGDDACWRPVVEATTEFHVKKDSTPKQSMLPLESSAGKKDRSTDWQLTYANLVPRAINHAREFKLTGNLRSVVEHMLANTRWRPSYYMVNNGVPDHFVEDFAYRSGKRSAPPMEWFAPKFARV